VADNVGVGRPEQVAILFARQVRTTTKAPFRTRVFGPGTEVKLDFAYQHSRVKQSLKEGKALRIQMSATSPTTSVSWRAWSICPSWWPRLERSTVVC
jgi:hypothetical protein